MASTAVLELLRFLQMSAPGAMLSSLQNLSYFLIFILFIIEGPVTNFVAAFAASLGFFNVYIIFILVVFGNIIADIAFYLIGHLGKQATVERYLHKSLKPGKIQKLKIYFKHNPGKTLLVTKLTPLLPVPGLIMAGMSDVPFRKFMFYSFSIGAAYALVITSLGYYSGAAFGIIFKYFKYGIYLGGAFIILIMAVWLLIAKRISDRIEKI